MILLRLSPRWVSIYATLLLLYMLCDTVIDFVKLELYILFVVILSANTGINNLITNNAFSSILT